MGFDPAFLPVPVTADEIVEAAMYFRGLRYSKAGTFVTETPAGPKGFCDCAGLFLLVARRLELLPTDFDLNLAPAVTGVSRETALRAIMVTNFTRVPNDEMRPGDIFVVKWEDDGDPESWGRHLAIHTSSEPAPHGSMLHAINGPSGEGSVFEQLIDGTLWGRIWRVYRLNSLMEVPHGE